MVTEALRIGKSVQEEWLGKLELHLQRHDREGARVNNELQGRL